MVISHHLLWQTRRPLAHVLEEPARRALRARALRQRVHREQPRRAAPGRAQRASPTRLTGLGNRHWMNDDVRARGHARTHSGQVAVPHDDRRRQLQSLQRSVRPHRRRPRARRGRRGAARVPAADRLDRALRRRRVRRAAARTSTLEQAQQTAERLRQQVARLSPPSLSTAITISIGVSTNRSDDDVATLVQRADAAMYDAKERGRNRVAIRDDVRSRGCRLGERGRAMPRRARRASSARSPHSASRDRRRGAPRRSPA